MIARREDRVLVLRALLAPLLFFAPFGLSLPSSVEPLVLALIFYLLLDANYVLHLHAHRPLTESRAVNLLLDLCLGATTGMTASNWRIQHIHGHHQGRDEPFRTNKIDLREDYSVVRALTYSALSIWPTFFAPLMEALKKGVLRRETQPIDYTWAFMEQCLPLAIVGLLIQVNPSLTFFYVIPSFISVYFGSRYIDYLNHYGCDERDANVFARSNNCLDPSFNRRLNNFGLHSAHHARPAAHWTEVPSIHAEIAARIPPARLKRFSWSLCAIPQHFRRAARQQM